jgi:hypothetical protein
MYKLRRLLLLTTAKAADMRRVTVSVVIFVGNRECAVSLRLQKEECRKKGDELPKTSKAIPKPAPKQCEESKCRQIQD